MQRPMPLIVMAALLAGLMGGCNSSTRSMHAPRMSAGASMRLSDVRNAIAVIHPASGTQVTGTVMFTQLAQGVRVVAILQGLPPNSRHGIHIHDYGDCSAPDARSAGGHYNPEGMPHGAPASVLRHAGDLGNIEADNAGVGRLELILSDVTLVGERNPLLGRSVVVHAQADDLSSQPAGNSGGRIGCGVIGVARGQP